MDVEIDEDDLQFERIIELLQIIRNCIKSEPHNKFIGLNPEDFEAWTRLLVFMELRDLPKDIFLHFPNSVLQLEQIESVLRSSSIDTPEVIEALKSLVEIDATDEHLEGTEQDLKAAILNLSDRMMWLLRLSERGSLARVFLLNNAIDGGLMSYWASALYAKLGFIGIPSTELTEDQRTLAEDYKATMLLWEAEHFKFESQLKKLPTVFMEQNLFELPKALAVASTKDIHVLLDCNYFMGYLNCDEIHEILSTHFENLGDYDLKSKWDGMVKQQNFTNSFEFKAKVVATYFTDRLREELGSEITDIVANVYDTHDMSGPLAVAFCGGDIKIISNESRGWIETTYDLLGKSLLLPIDEIINELEENSKIGDKYSSEKSPSVETILNDVDDELFELKVQLVATAFRNRLEVSEESEVLQKIFDPLNLSGAIALALNGNDIELVTDAPREWINETFESLNEVFDFSEDIKEQLLIPVTESEVFAEYLDKELNIKDVELRDKITTRHHSEVYAGGAVINLLEVEGVGIELNLGFDCHAQISTIHASPDDQEVVGVIVLTYGPWTISGGWGSTYVGYVSKLAKGDKVPPSFLLEGCEKIHFLEDFIENQKPKIYSIEEYLGFTSYSDIDEIESISELEFSIPMSGEFVVGNLIYGNPVTSEELQALDEGNWNEWPFIVIRKDIYDRINTPSGS